ncbi:MAG: isoleucine--tRNA ligase [Patescibacteria group bacterium]|nr:MAG: isoleucine--tRNA ligase [Patescibacteria group bacterium]
MKNKFYFNPISPKVSFQEIERKMFDYWKENDVEKKYLKKNKNSNRYFSFLDGPITANNPMGVHHAWGRTYKDLWQRFKNMQGFKQRFQNGFDCQGLWVEVEVEKELGFKTKKDIEKYGVDKFVEKCKERVLKFAKIQTEQSKRLGYFMDWDNSYYTMSEENNYMIWYFLKVCHENGWIYKGNDSVPWCPRCETAISQHEILTEDYKELTHTSIVLKFPIVGRENEYLLVWTTTPWTIPANVAVAVDKDLEYAMIEDRGSYYWLAKDCVKRIFKEDRKPLKFVRGEKLLGLKYRTAFDDLPAVKEVSSHPNFHTVVATDDRIMPITVEEGTGLVHTAVSAGTEDYRLGQKINLPMIPVINDDASYKENLGFLAGLNAKKDPNIIFDYLDKREKEYGENWVFDKFEYKHRYPVCWRCKEELVWKVTDEWYIAMDRPTKVGKSKGLTLRQRLMKTAKKINWIPSFGLKREIDWLENMQDWLISKKNRYWGLALPIWECDKCGNFEVIGSKEELKERAVSGWEKFEGKTPHKPQIDFVKIRCSKCGTIISRIEPVGNPWLDAGIVSFSTISKDNKSKPLYLVDKKEWRKWFPSDFITESFPGQFKNWFYSLIAMSTVLEDENPTKTILGFATLLAEDGRPMHKSWGNFIEFNEGAEKIGVDVMRWIYVRQNVSENLLFGYKLADETRRRFHLKLWNIYNFFVTYANIDGWTPDENIKNTNLDILDRWILLRFKELLEKVTLSLEKYDASLASGLIEDFVDDLSNWYIRRSRQRVGPWAQDNLSKEAFYKTLYLIMKNLSKLLAPFTPFLSDEIYQNLTKELSVHLASWPDVDLSFLEDGEELITKMNYLRNCVEKVHSKRKELGIPIRQPLLKAEIGVADKSYEKLDRELLMIAEEELNIKELLFRFSKEEYIKLDTKITPQLEEEAKTRELIRKVQEERKKMNISFTQPSVIFSPWQPKNKSLLEAILKKTYSEKIINSDRFEVKTLNEK